MMTALTIGLMLSFILIMRLAATVGELSKRFDEHRIQGIARRCEAKARRVEAVTHRFEVMPLDTLSS